jgi:uncharacterized BrkB/YihY/UPF0761 family membrane protein
MNWKLVFMCVMIFGMFAVGVLAQTDEEIIEQKIESVTSLVSLLGGAIGVLALTVIGVMMMYTTDPAEKNQLKERLKYVIIGTVLIVVAPYVISYLLA